MMRRALLLAVLVTLGAGCTSDPVAAAKKECEALIEAAGGARVAPVTVLRLPEERGVIKSESGSLDWKATRDQHPDEWHRAWRLPSNVSAARWSAGCLLQRAGL